MKKSQQVRIASAVGGVLNPLLKLHHKLKTHFGDKLYSQIIKHSFAQPLPLFFSATPPVKLDNPDLIHIGDHVRIAEYSTISAYTHIKGNPKFLIGNNVRIGAFAHLTCANEIIIEDNVLLGKNVTISDNSHGHNWYSELDSKPIDRPLYSKGGVHICKNVWIGDKATILPGVTVGAYSIVGANSVVTKDIPPYSVACGNPAKIVRTIESVT